MRESGYYPPGAEFDPSAPYNQVETPDKEFEITCSQSLSRTTMVTTNNYVHYVDEGCEDGVGYHDEWDEFPDTDWSKEYDDNGYKTPLQLIQILKEYLKKDLDNIDTIVKETKQNKEFLERRLKHLIEECDCWNDDETEYSL